jgi:hypothetical protein
MIYGSGPHTPSLTPKEIDLLHKVWLDVSDKLQGEEIHHHDIIHFALAEIERAIGRQDPEVLERLREHIREIQTRRKNSPDPPC